MSKVPLTGPLKTDFELVVCWHNAEFQMAKLSNNNGQIFKWSFLPTNTCFYSILSSCLFVFFKYQESANFFFCLC